MQVTLERFLDWIITAIVRVIHLRKKHDSAYKYSQSSRKRRPRRVPDKDGQNLKGGHFKRMGSLRQELLVKSLAYVVIYDRFRQNSNLKIAYVVYHPKFDKGRVNASSAGGCLRKLKSEAGNISR